MDICQVVPEAILAWLTKGNMSDETALIKKKKKESSEEPKRDNRTNAVAM